MIHKSADIARERVMSGMQMPKSLSLDAKLDLRVNHFLMLRKSN